MMAQNASATDTVREEDKIGSPKVSVVIPALNEAENLPHVLPKLPSIVDEVILVDGHSTDGTVEIAKKLRPDLIFVRQDGKGKGNALKCGIGACTGDIIVTIDADGSMDPEEIPSFVKPLLNGYDFVKGSRFVPGAGTLDMERHRKLGNWVFVSLVNFLYRGHYTDLCYGYNAMRRSAIREISITADGFEIETEMNVTALKAGLKVAEVPSYEAPRIHGTSNLRAFQDGIRILKTIFRYRFGNMKVIPGNKQPGAEKEVGAEI